MSREGQGTSPGQEPGKLLSRTGRTRGGDPLAFNHQPSPDLAPWFTWFSVTDAEIPDGHQIVDGMFNDHAIIRIMFCGHWTAQTRDGEVVLDPGEKGMTVYFGPQTKVMPIVGSGKIKVLSVHLGPGAASVLGGPRQEDMLDRIVDHDKLVGHGSLSSRFHIDGTPHEWLKTFEHELRKFLQINDTAPPDPITLAFEHETLANPSFALTEFAARQDCSTRTVERIIKRDYGLSPKQVCRRARALDMAAALLGVAMEEEEAELRLRYFDQSHLIREIKAFFGTTPQELRNGNHPFLRLNLEVRQSRRVQALSLLPPDTIEPWRDPTAEPFSGE